jgi:hypothetical protein
MRTPAAGRRTPSVLVNTRSTPGTGGPPGVPLRAPKPLEAAIHCLLVGGLGEVERGDDELAIR